MDDFDLLVVSDLCERSRTRYGHPQTEISRLTGSLSVSSVLIRERWNPLKQQIGEGEGIGVEARFDRHLRRDSVKRACHLGTQSSKQMFLLPEGNSLVEEAETDHNLED